ncbi:ABC transporter substrate-binding protein [Saxibacter everestensis]|uniref:ABC transporter substrate-binding protein n=1 Tax=Saxibacter everestensis TaxID=2909229 RepID=A0ABY8QV53_9MICO|nr:ABC transporter substrate-binding protein [Brevibacteriaceae bacterium ZFBP1038]
MLTRKSGWLTATAVAGVAVLTLSGCTTSSGGGGDSGGGGGALTVGTTDKVTSLDPAGSYDNGSFVVMNQIYPFLMNSTPGSAEPKPDIAESADFTEPTKYEVKLKSGLKWSNGNELTSSDVKFTFDRQLKIADENGPSSLLGSIDNIETPDDTTVVFNLKQANDQTFPQVLTSPAGPIVDEDVFSPDAVTPDQEIIDGKAFAGPYDITSYKANDLVGYKANPNYKGLLGAPKTDTVNMKYYTDSNNMKLDIEKSNIDVAYRSLSPTDVEDLGKNDAVSVKKGPGGESRYMVFNFDTQPFGAKSEDPDEKKAQAVRQAVADSIDRDAIAKQVYKGTYTPLYSFVPEGLPGATTPLKEKYGDGNGKADADRAKKRLEDAGINEPVELKLQYSPDHYGPSSGDEYALIKDQLEKTGMFKVDLQSTEWVQYSEDRTADAYPAYQLGWFPDYSDADNYLTPFFTKENFLANHYDNKEVQDLIAKQVGITDKAERQKMLGEIQDKVADDLSTIPYLQGAQVAVASKDVKGVEDTLDASFKLRLGVIAK